MMECFVIDHLIIYNSDADYLRMNKFCDGSVDDGQFWDDLIDGWLFCDK